MVNPLKNALICLLAFSCTAPSPQGKELRLYTWSEYFDQSLIQEFEKENGVKVKVDYFASNEQMLTKLQLTQGSKGYDLILPSDYMVRNLVEMKLLQPLDKKLLPFLSELEKEAINPPYDPGLIHTVPLAVGSTGLAWNKKLLPKLPPKLTWKELFENPDFAGKVTLLDDTKEVLQAALLAQGKNLAGAGEAEIKEAFVYLKRKKKQLKGFTSETRPVVEADECALCMVYSGDAYSIAKEKPEIQFVLPEDGASRWTDNFAIPANASEPALAHKFITKVLSAQGSKSFTERTGYRTFHRRGKELLAKEIAGNPTVYPKVPASRFHYIVEKKEFLPLIDREWALLKSL
jgi:spermidine/putrescine transport system substrate-binding protein